MLVDDNYADNYYHSVEIKKTNPGLVIIEKSMALDALRYLEWNKKTNFLPELIFLDLNMPGMDGWEFLEEYRKLKISHIKIIILSTSRTEEELNRAKTCTSVADYLLKPLTESMMKGVTDKFFR
jgi:CheY-like chemotaxis protein